jgi:hypothetical protein
MTAYAIVGENIHDQAMFDAYRTDVPATLAPFEGELGHGRLVGANAAACVRDGRSGDIDLLCWPVDFSLSDVGSSRAEAVEARLKASGASPPQTLAHPSVVPVIAFDGMSK